MERGKTREPCNPRLHDRHRSCGCAQWRGRRGRGGMNGIHDMGGMQGFGRVEPEAGEPVFHAPWEGRVLAMHRAMGYVGLWTIDINRAARETMPPALYLSTSYYEKWAISLEDLCVRYGLVSGDELAAGRALRPALPVKRLLSAAEVPKALSRKRFEREAP